MANKGFYCMDGYLKRTERLTDEELGRLFRACMIYHATGEVTELDGRESVAFDFIKEDIDMANEAYAAKCETNRRNRTGTTDDDRQRPSTTVNETERPTTNGDESRKVKVKVKENVKEKEKESDPMRAGARARTREETEKQAERFERFWAAYPRHEGKKKAEESFKKVCQDDTMLETILQALANWKRSEQWMEDGGRYIPHPTTWLNGRRWEDEVPRFRHDPKNTVIAQQYEQRDYSGMEESMEDVVLRLMREHPDWEDE